MAEQGQEQVQITWTEEYGYAAIDFIQNGLYLAGLLGIALYTFTGSRWPFLWQLAENVFGWPLLEFLPPVVNRMLPPMFALTLIVAITTMAISSWITWYNKSAEKRHLIEEDS
ncbi:hypothetical protein [Halococcus salifodinae]|jgi:hypothetical protein|uniref:Uncharacterized protein n=1 Tax=Halococcus salifodinae DSM 8989 TaxID=1227456 RepID=M0ND26_9EURY|nr:hypothetical protein [Halococcus salifodinae]EMA54565.1 hypothetical protein C450_05900 [Halococcus salifodinae DSM 8989]